MSRPRPFPESLSPPPILSLVSSLAAVAKLRTGSNRAELTDERDAEQTPEASHTTRISRDRGRLRRRAELPRGTEGPVLPPLDKMRQALA